MQNYIVCTLLLDESTKYILPHGIHFLLNINHLRWE